MTLLSIVLVPKTGVLEAINIKHHTSDLEDVSSGKEFADLYKRAGFKHATDFVQHAVYTYGDKAIHVYGKSVGRAGQENKYEFPPPIAETLFFGTVVLVAKVADKPVNFSVEEWNMACEALMGGFEDLQSEELSEDSASASSTDVTDEELTRDGYSKSDGFVVDDDEEDVEEEEEEVVVECKKISKRKSVVKPRKKRALENVFVVATEAMTTLDCSQELSEEEYVA